MGKVSFTELMLLQLTGTMPTRAQVHHSRCCARHDHGARARAFRDRYPPDCTTARRSPSQGAIVAGLLGVGDRFAGTASECSQAAGADRSGSRRRAHATVAVEAREGAACSEEARFRASGIRFTRMSIRARRSSSRSPRPLGAKGDYIAALETLEKAVERRHRQTHRHQRECGDCRCAMRGGRSFEGVARHGSHRALCRPCRAICSRKLRSPAGEAMWNAVIRCLIVDGRYPLA